MVTSAIVGVGVRGQLRFSLSIVLTVHGALVVHDATATTTEGGVLQVYLVVRDIIRLD